MLNDKQRRELVDRLLHSPSYRVAYRDPELMDLPEFRHARMELEFLKADLILRQHNVESTIVVFGSSQVCEPAAAQKRLYQARARLTDTPDDPRRRRDLARAERIAATLADLPEHYESVLRAKYLDGATVAQVAKASGQTPKAVESLLTRARQAFRERYLALESDGKL